MHPFQTRESKQISGIFLICISFMQMPSRRLFAMSTRPRTKSLIEGNLNWLNMSIGWASTTVQWALFTVQWIVVAVCFAEVFVCCSFLAAQWFGIVLDKMKNEPRKRCRVGRLAVAIGGSPPRCVGFCGVLNMVACFEVFIV